MIVFPAIDLYEGKVVRLLRGDYSQMTVYSRDPEETARELVRSGAGYIHIVDLKSARTGRAPDLGTVTAIKRASGAFCEAGGGIRSMETVERFLSAGIDRVVIGTAAVTDGSFLAEAVKKYGGRIAVGVDIRDGAAAINGWTETSGLDAFDFCRELCRMGVETLICTDISRDGAMRGTNRELYRALAERFDMNITASGGINSQEDLKALSDMGLYGAIVGKAYYTGAIDLRRAIEVAK